MKEQIFEKLKEVIANNIKVPKEEISMESTFDDLGMDSLDGITILNEMENIYNITLPNELVRKMASVREVVDNMDEFLKNPPPPGSAENDLSIDINKSNGTPGTNPATNA